MSHESYHEVLPEKRLRRETQIHSMGLYALNLSIPGVSGVWLFYNTSDSEGHDQKTKKCKSIKTFLFFFLPRENHRLK
jgi:hypothetical protein